MIIGITSFVLISAMLLVVRKMPSRPGIEWWIAGTLSVAFSYLLAFIFYEKENTVIGETVFTILQLSSHFGFVVGTLLFFNQEVYKRRYFFVFFITLITTCLLNFNEEKLLADLLFAAFLSGGMLYVAFRLFKLTGRNKSITATAVIYTMIGIHWLNYPFINTIEWLAPIGFLIGMMLGMSMGFALALLVLLQFEKQTKKSEQRAIYAATHDPLTGLYNRSHLDTLFKRYVSEVIAEKFTFAMLYLDLDGFKVVNDAYGHKAGDFLLKVIAERLANLLHDRGDAIRIGGDEIVILARLRADNSYDHVYGLARKTLDTIEQPIVNGEQTYNVSASIGVCSYPLHGDNLAALLEEADSLMYAAKKGGRKQIKFADFTKKIEILAPMVKLQASPALADIA